MKRTYKSTAIACYIGYIVQAIVNNLSPIFFIIYQDELGISYSMLSWLVFINFATQLITDMLSVHFTERVGHKNAVAAANICAGVGLVLLGVLPKVMGGTFISLVIPTMICAVGGGLIEVLISPIVDMLPGEMKSAKMSFLHSFYCWGQMLTVLATTVLLYLVGTELWFIIPMLWAIIPLANGVNFISVPIIDPVSGDEKVPVKTLLSSKVFIAMLILMLAAGSSELTMSQWASLFAEKGLGVSKVIGDIAGPCAFAFLMGLGRVIHGAIGGKMKIETALLSSALLCVVTYLVASLSPLPIVSLIACAICGLSVAVMWPGTYSMASEKYEKGGTSMFAMLAIFGDLGCSVGPWFAGLVSTGAAMAGVGANDQLRWGIGASVIFPLMMVIIILGMKLKGKKKA